MMPGNFDGVQPLRKSEHDLIEKVAKAIPENDYKSLEDIATDADVDVEDAKRVIKLLIENNIVDQKDNRFRSFSADERD